MVVFTVGLDLMSRLGISCELCDLAVMDHSLMLENTDRQSISSCI